MQAQGLGGLAMLQVQGITGWGLRFSGKALSAAGRVKCALANRRQNSCDLPHKLAIKVGKQQR